MSNILDLSNKIALVTGASSGIGAATAQLLAQLGANVAVGYHNNQAGAQKAAASVQAAGRKALALQADMREPDQVRRLVRETVSGLGPIDILVNNAGSLVQRLPLATLAEARWDEVMNLNLKSVLICTQAVMPSMIERRAGSIVNIVSIAGRNGGGSGAGVYSTAKGGLITLTKAFAKELAPHHVRV